MTRDTWLFVSIKGAHKHISAGLVRHFCHFLSKLVPAPPIWIFIKFALSCLFGKFTEVIFSAPYCCITDVVQCTMCTMCTHLLSLLPSASGCIGALHKVYFRATFVLCANSCCSVWQPSLLRCKLLQCSAGRCNVQMSKCPNVQKSKCAKIRPKNKKVAETGFQF